MKKYKVGDRVEFKGVSGKVVHIVPNVNDPSIQVIVRVEWDDGFISSLACQQRGLNVKKE